MEDSVWKTSFQAKSCLEAWKIAKCQKGIRKSSDVNSTNAKRQILVYNSKLQKPSKLPKINHSILNASKIFQIFQVDTRHVNCHKTWFFSPHNFDFPTSGFWEGKNRFFGRYTWNLRETIVDYESIFCILSKSQILKKNIENSSFWAKIAYFSLNFACLTIKSATITHGDLR